MGVRQLRAFVFDFDGLILDTEEPIYRSWLEVYQAHGEDLPFDRWIETVGSNNAADVGPQFACADIKPLGHFSTAVLLADQQRKRKGRTGTAYLVRITSQNPGFSRHNLQGGGLT